MPHSGTFNKCGRNATADHGGKIVFVREQSLKCFARRVFEGFPQNLLLSHREAACAMADPLLFSGSRNKALRETVAAGCKREVAVLLSES